MGLRGFGGLGGGEVLVYHRDWGEGTCLGLFCVCVYMGRGEREGGGLMVVWFGLLWDNFYL